MGIHCFALSYSVSTQATAKKFEVARCGMLVYQYYSIG